MTCVFTAPDTRTPTVRTYTTQLYSYKKRERREGGREVGREREGEGERRGRGNERDGESETQRERGGGRERERGGERETDRQTDRETERFGGIQPIMRVV